MRWLQANLPRRLPAPSHLGITVQALALSSHQPAAAIGPVHFRGTWAAAAGIPRAVRLAWCVGEASSPPTTTLAYTVVRLCTLCTSSRRRHIRYITYIKPSLPQAARRRAHPSLLAYHCRQVSSRTTSSLARYRHPYPISSHPPPVGNVRGVPWRNIVAPLNAVRCPAHHQRFKSSRLVFYILVALRQPCWPRSLPIAPRLATPSLRSMATGCLLQTRTCSAMSLVSSSTKSCWTVSRRFHPCISHGKQQLMCAS